MLFVWITIYVCHDPLCPNRPIMSDGPNYVRWPNMSDGSKYPTKRCCVGHCVFHWNINCSATVRAMRVSRDTILPQWRGERQAGHYVRTSPFCPTAQYVRRPIMSDRTVNLVKCPESQIFCCDNAYANCTEGSMNNKQRDMVQHIGIRGSIQKFWKTRCCEVGSINLVTYFKTMFQFMGSPKSQKDPFLTPNFRYKISCKMDKNKQNASQTCITTGTQCT